MLSLQVCLKRVTLLVIVLSCFLEKSCGFQVSPAFTKRRNHHQLPPDVKVAHHHHSFRSSLTQPSTDQKSNHASCMSSMALRSKRYGSFDSQTLRYSFDRPSPSLILRRPDESRLHAAKGDDDSPISSKIRSFVSKVYNALTSRVKKVIRWIRNKFKKTDEFLEETIEEQEKAVEKAIADIGARASEIQAKKAALASDQAMLDETDPASPKAATVPKVVKEQTAPTTEKVSPAEVVKSETADDEAKEVKAKSSEPVTAAPGPTAELEAEETIATLEAQTDVVEKVEDVQTTDAALVSEQSMLSQLDQPTTPSSTEQKSAMDDIVAQETIATLEAQTDVVEKVEDVQTADAALVSEQSMLSQLDQPTTTPSTEQKSGMDDIVAQETIATLEAQTEVVEKVEDVQTMDAVLATEEGMLAQLDKMEPRDSDVMTEMQPSQEQQSRAKPSSGKPAGDRWAIAAPGVDLSGDWSLIVSDDFKKKYDEYLKQLGQPFLVRSVALTLVGVTTEHTEQKEEGRTLFIRGTNARGIWDRTMVTSGADMMNEQFTPLHVPVDTADDERVEAEAWWEEDGTVHRSWMRGISKYGGGDFESKRYLGEDGKVLVCESIFHPANGKLKDRKQVGVTWRFLKDGETLNS